MSHLVSLPTSTGSLPLPNPNQQRLVQRKAAILPWIANPLHLFLEHEHGHGHGGHHQPLAMGEGGHEHKQAHAETPVSRADTIYEEIEAEEAHPLELFYDLFFVANLTTITSVHVMTDYDSLVSYILFFIILWFTWLQTTFYDIRFTNDSFYERVVRAIHYAVMIGFASVSTLWNPQEAKYEKAMNNLMSMTLTLCISRVALTIQYGVATIYAVKHFKKAILPLTIHTLTMLAAGIAYLGLYFSFRDSGSSKTYLAWYAIILVEVISVMGSSMIWKNAVSFKRTHLVERLGLLTLIIIGEGIIVMLKAVNTVEKGSGLGRGWSASIFFVVACAVLILYMFYMFYFDYTPRGVHYGTIRQQFWAVLHFPFHLAIVLSVEGLRQLTTWWSFAQANAQLDNKFTLSQNSTDPEVNWQNLLAEIESVLYFLFDDGNAKDVVKNWGDILYELDGLKNVTAAEFETNQGAVIDYVQVYFDLISGFAEWYGIKTPKSKGRKATVGELVDQGLDPFAYDPSLTIMKVYDLVYTYFFSALAVVFFMYGVLGLFVRRKKDGWDYFSVGWRWAIGLVFIGIERLKTNEKLYQPFLNSFWPIPTVAIIIFVTLFVDKFVGFLAYKRLKASMFY